jgi:hypothetical protein
MQENQWPRNPVLTFWQSKRICSDNAPICIEMVADTRMSPLDAVDGSSTSIAMCQIAPAIQ